MGRTTALRREHLQLFKQPLHPKCSMGASHPQGSPTGRSGPGSLDQKSTRRDLSSRARLVDSDKLPDLALEGTDVICLKQRFVPPVEHNANTSIQGNATT